jgi:hypothetical protein
MEPTEKPDRAKLERLASRALLEPDSQTVADLDRLLTDCAAEILDLRERRTRLEGELRRLAAEWERLSALMANLQELRDRTESRPSDGG